jgi:rubredoxin
MEHERQGTFIFGVIQMARYTCMNCGYVFDEDKGTPGGRIPPNRNTMLKTGCGWHKNIENTPCAAGVKHGTKWEDVPREFVCPSCGCGKDMFE